MYRIYAGVLYLLLKTRETTFETPPTFPHRRTENNSICIRSKKTSVSHITAVAIFTAAREVSEPRDDGFQSATQSQSTTKGTAPSSPLNLRTHAETCARTDNSNYNICAPHLLTAPDPTDNRRRRRRRRQWRRRRPPVWSQKHLTPNAHSCCAYFFFCCCC